MRLKREHPGFYVTEDGLYEVQFVDDYETECDEPHPVKVRADTPGAEFQANEARRAGCNLKRKTKRTKKGYVEYLTWQCPGGLTHFYSRWTVGLAGEGEYAPGSNGPSGYDTLRDARSFVASLYERTDS